MVCSNRSSRTTNTEHPSSTITATVLDLSLKFLNAVFQLVHALPFRAAVLASNYIVYGLLYISVLLLRDWSHTFMLDGFEELYHVWICSSSEPFAKLFRYTVTEHHEVEKMVCAECDVCNGTAYGMAAA